MIAGNIAVVTGAGSGIGWAVAQELARRQVAGIVMVDLSPVVEQRAAELAAVHARAVKTLALVGDVTSESFRRQTFDRATGELGLPRICVPAAGLTRDGLAVKIDRDTGRVNLYAPDDFHKVLEVNLVAPTYWALEMIGRIAEDRARRQLRRWQPQEDVQGVIVFVGSVSSQGNRGQVAYAATKAGLEGVSATLMQEGMYHGVRSVVVHPGFTDTPMVQALGSQLLAEQVLPQTQLGRLVRPQEIAEAVCFLVGNPAITGALWADAGWRPRP